METPTPVLSTCLICLETRALKIVGNCKHSFCTECLSTVLGSLESGSEVFACPSCKVDCPLPWDGVNGMVDFTGNTVDVVDTDTERVVASAVNETKPEGQEMLESATGDVICDLCDYKQKKVPAANMCSACDNLSICKDCSTAHGTNKASKKHILTPLATQKQHGVSMCKMHHKLLIRFCLTCKEPVCKLCVLLDHSDHDSEELADTIWSNIDVLKVTLGQREVKLKEMQELHKQLTLLKAMAPIVDKQDTLIKEIEDHAEKCIDQIVKWKEDLKKQVKMDYKIVRDIPICLEKVSEVIQQLQLPINGATQLLSVPEHRPAYLDRLKTMQQDLEAIATTGDGVEGSECWDQLLNLNSDDNSFAPEALQTTCGKICKSPKSGNFEPKEIFQHKMQVDSEDTYIPCIAVLGHKYYAVAHSVKLDQQAEAIDIYEFPGTLKNTLKDHVAPLYDMSATPDGNIAVLSAGTEDSTCRVKLFNPETGYISSTRDIDVAKPLSLAVTLQDQLIILGENDQGQTQISCVDKTGSLVDEYNITEDDSERITCGGRFIFVSTSGKKVYVFEIKNNEIQKTAACQWNGIRGITDISATIYDDFFLTEINNVVNQETKNIYLDRIQDRKTTFEWKESKEENVQENVTGTDREARVSTRDGHTVVMSHGQTIKVFKC